MKPSLPNLHVMTLLTYIALLPPVYYIPPLVTEHISSDNWWVTIISLAITVPITNYVSLPLMVRGVAELRSE